MKNTIRIFIKGGISFVLTLLTVLSFAQIIPCDTCTYNYDHKWTPKHLDSVVKFQPQSQGEYQGCIDDTVRRKNITFIHGLGGSVASWDKQKTWTDDNYRSAVVIATYNGADYESSFHSVALKLNGDISSGIEYGVNKKHPDRCMYDDFAIAHSQGGIAARYLDWKWNVNQNGTFGINNFYGLVTFGTPHAGADIALTRDEHAEFIGQVVSSVFLKKTYDLRGLFPGIDKLLDSTDVFIEQKLVPIMIAGVHTNTLDEMAPGSPTMDSINNHQSRLRKVAFYGIEEAPEAWRVMDGVVTKAAEDYPIFTATDDQTFVDKVETTRHSHSSKIVSNKNKMKRLHASAAVLGAASIGLIPFTGGWSATGLGGVPVILKKVDKLANENLHRGDAVQFLNNANTQWRYLIGSHHRDSFELITETYYILNWSEKYGIGGRWYGQTREFGSLQELSSYWQNIKVYKTKNQSYTSKTRTSKKIKFYPSDGVVLVKSQLAFPGVGSRTDKMEGDNHFQERNSPETHRVMKKLYKGGYDKYFETLEQ